MITELANEQFGERGRRYDYPKKHFAFGRLGVRSEESIIRAGKPTGQTYMQDLTWWYHVALTIKIKVNDESKIYILDPSVSRAPLEKEAWYDKISWPWGDEAITGYITCDSDTYTPSDDCFSPAQKSNSFVNKELEYFLKL